VAGQGPAARHRQARARVGRCRRQRIAARSPPRDEAGAPGAD
jgi:hypothetical protein